MSTTLNANFSDIPMDVVKFILSYDERYAIRSGKIMRRLDKHRYANIIELLLNKPIPEAYRCTHEVDYYVISSRVKLPNNIWICYHLRDSQRLVDGVKYKKFRTIKDRKMWKSIDGITYIYHNFRDKSVSNYNVFKIL